MKKIEHNGNKNAVGKRVREARNKKGLTQNQLAAKMQLLNVNIDQKMISKIELNKRLVTDYEVICLAKILEVTTAWLLEDYRV